MLIYWYMFEIAKNYKDESEKIKHIIDLCTSYIDMHSYADGDTRVVVFSNIRGLAYASILITNFLDSWTIGDEKIREIIPQLIGLTSLNTESVNLAGNVLHKSNKLNLAILANFQIENFVVHILSALKLKTKKDTFFYRVGTLLTHLNLSRYMDDFVILSLIRNSLHTNGIHIGYKGESKKYVRSGIRYEFIHGRLVECASLSHITLALQNVLGVVNKIVQHKLIKDIETINDTYFIQKIIK